MSVTPYNRTTNTGGVLIIDARNIRIEGTLTGNEAGYPGGQPNSQGGQQGDSINGRLQILVIIPPFLFVNMIRISVWFLLSSFRSINDKRPTGLNGHLTSI